MRREAGHEMTDLYNKPNNVFKLVKVLKKEGQDVNGGWTMFEKNKWQTCV